VTSTAYGGYSTDNGYYLTVKGYDQNGNAVTFKGGFGVFVYATKADAQDIEVEMGIYHFETDSESGLYMLSADPVVEFELMDSIQSKDPCLGDGVATDDTVYVIATYNKSGLIIGYTVVKGFRNIKDLTDAELEASSVTVEFEAAVLDLDEEGSTDGDGFIDLVFVTGAGQTADKAFSFYSDDIFFVMRTTPDSQTDEYDLYTAVLDGEVTKLKVHTEANWTFDEVGFYLGTGQMEDYWCEFELMSMADIEVLTSNILTYNGEVWESAPCQDGMIVLADDVKIVDVLRGEEVEVSQLIIDPKQGCNGLNWNYVKGFAVEYNSYGEVTLLYVLGGYPPKTVTVTATYNTGKFDTSYFKAGSDKYWYSENFHVIVDGHPVPADSDAILDEFALHTEVTIHFDYFGKVILIEPA